MECPAAKAILHEPDPAALAVFGVPEAVGEPARWQAPGDEAEHVGVGDVLARFERIDCALPDCLFHNGAPATDGRPCIFHAPIRMPIQSISRNAGEIREREKPLFTGFSEEGTGAG
jgi:hypothetical protein